MRIVFTRNINNPPSGSKTNKKPWPLLQNMIFLKSFVTAKGYLQFPLSQSLEDDDYSVVSDTVDEEKLEEPNNETMNLRSKDVSTIKVNKAINLCSEETRPPPKKKRRKPTHLMLMRE